MDIDLLLLSTPPTFLPRARQYGATIAHMAYQIGTDFRLHAENIPLCLSGGYMLLGDSGSVGGDPYRLIWEIIEECKRRQFDGVILAFEDTRPVLRSFTVLLAERLFADERKLFLPESLADLCTRASILVSTAISGGRLGTRLHEAIAHYGAERICLDLERVRRDFILPSGNGEGKRLTASELYALVAHFRPQSYFSRELAAFYFTYTDKQGTHFVLYDDIGSMQHKIQLAGEMGIRSAILLYPEVEDFAGQLME